MKTKIFFRIFSVIAILAVGVYFLSQTGVVSAASNAQGGPGGTRGFGQAAGAAVPNAGYALAPLTSAEASALQEAVLEEYGALNLYQSAINQVGNVYPFSQIVLAEQQHVNVLVKQAEKYGIAVPANPGLTSQPVFDTLAQACQMGVDAEIADAALYDDLKLVTTHPDLIQVYNNLQSASLNNHLPAFQTCD